MRQVGLGLLGAVACAAAPEGSMEVSSASTGDTGEVGWAVSCEVVATEVVQLVEGDPKGDFLAKTVADLPGRFEGSFFHASGSVPALWVVDSSLGEVRKISMEGSGQDCVDHYEIGFGVSWTVEGWVDARFTTVMEIVPGEWSLYEADLPWQSIVDSTSLEKPLGQEELLLEGSYEAGVWQGILVRMGPEPQTLGSFLLSKVD